MVQLFVINVRPRKAIHKAELFPLQGINEAKHILGESILGKMSTNFAYGHSVVTDFLCYSVH